jgi:CBS domain-containing protein
VVNQRGKLVGVVSLTDIAQCAAEGGEVAPSARRPGARASGWEAKLNPDDLRQVHIEDAGRVVRDIMTPTVYTIPDSTPVSKVARTMISGRVHRLLVTRGKRIVGIVTTLDMLKLLA